jgi:hypothetical protein
MFIHIHTHENGECRFLLVEGFFAHFRRQPFIHDCLLTVNEGTQSHTFQLFFKNHRSMPLNTNISRMVGNRTWRGDMIIMQAGKHAGKTVVNMRGRDAGLADFAIVE